MSWSMSQIYKWSSAYVCVLPCNMNNFLMSLKKYESSFDIIHKKALCLLLDPAPISLVDFPPLIFPYSLLAFC